MNTLVVDTGEHRYDVIVGHLGDCRGRLLDVAAGKPLTVVTDEHLWNLHGERLSSLLPCQPLFVPRGEEAKDWANLQRLIDAFAARNLDRNDAVLAFGGGSIGDLTGLAGGLFKRGLKVAHVPTTLLAQADSAVGGKTAIDALGQKNLVGMFHQPDLVIADIEMLDTLDARQLRSGYAEIVKYGAIGDPALFQWLEEHAAALLSGDREVRQEAVRQSVAAKVRAVEADVTDRSGVRALLNFGHTFGHAIESAAGLGTLLHGEAVAIGMMLAFDLSIQLGLCPASDGQRFRSHLGMAGLPATLGEADVDRAALLPLMMTDKKNDAGKLRLVLTHGIGRAFLSEGVEEHIVSDFLQRAA